METLFYSYELQVTAFITALITGFWSSHGFKRTLMKDVMLHVYLSLRKVYTSTWFGTQARVCYSLWLYCSTWSQHEFTYCELSVHLGLFVLAGDQGAFKILAQDLQPERGKIANTSV